MAPRPVGYMEKGASEDQTPIVHPGAASSSGGALSCLPDVKESVIHCAAVKLCCFFGCPSHYSLALTDTLYTLCFFITSNSSTDSHTFSVELLSNISWQYIYWCNVYPTVSPRKRREGAWMRVGSSACCEDRTLSHLSNSHAEAELDLNVCTVPV